MRGLIVTVVILLLSGTGVWVISGCLVNISFWAGYLVGVGAGALALIATLDDKAIIGMLPKERCQRHKNMT